MKYRINAVIVLFALIAALLTGCNLNKNSPQDSVVSDKNYPVTLNGITLNSAPSKVVVLSPSLAEIIVDMGFVSSLAGRAEECDQPASVAALPVVGSVLIPNIDAIYKLKPDLILVQKEPSQIIQNPRKTGTNVYIFHIAKREVTFQNLFFIDINNVLGCTAAVV